MIGIPYRIVRHGEAGPVDKVLYLATRRFGEAGIALKKTKKEYFKAEYATARAAQKLAAADNQIKGLPSDSKLMDELVSRRDLLMDEIRTHGDEATEAAEKLVVLSLTENYGRKNAEEMADQLTDRDLRGCVSTIELGAQPADFFPSNEAPQKPTTTLQSDASPGETFLPTDSAPRQSKGETSE
jgi:hypothetical protein